jgi:CRP-like cAMP-binding protein
VSRNKDLAVRLSQVPLFSRCDKRDLRIVARHAETLQIGRDQEVVRQGEPGDALFVILSGSARAERDGHQVQELVAGSYFGELALLDPAPRAATVRAVTDIEVAVLNVRMLRVLLREIPLLAAEMMAHLAGRVREAGSDRANAGTGGEAAG